jgi:hypothetical protein
LTPSKEKEEHKHKQKEMNGIRNEQYSSEMQKRQVMRNKLE